MQAGLLRRGATTTQQAADPGQQFGEGKRLDQIVVGAQFEAVNPVLHGVTGGQKKYRCVQAGAAHRLQNLPAITTRQHHIKNQQGIFAAEGQLLTGVAVGHQFGVEPGLGQALAQIMAGFRLVFDDQQFHGRLMASGTKALYRGQHSHRAT
ncbi:hypothetical protein D3C73_918690 [compost metagenome]